MHKSTKEALDYLKKLSKLISGKDVKKEKEIVLCPSFPLLPLMSKKKIQGVVLGAQNIHHEEQGPFTGEVSVLMVKDYCNYVIIGHSERRALGEENANINKKVTLALANGLKPVLCIGETFEERDNKNTKNVLEHQLTQCLSGVKEPENVVVAYEPVWAISKGQENKPASVQQVDEAVSFIRHKLAEIYSEEQALKMRIIYGGSVSPDNVVSLMSIENVDGCLPGSASLDPKKFQEIVFHDSIS